MLKAFMLVVAVLIPIQKLCAQETISIQLGVSGFKPYSTQDPDTGLCTGMAIDVTEKLLQTAGVQVNTVCKTPARLFRSISSGIIDLSVNIKSTKALENKVTFTKTPFDVLVLNFYSNEEDSSGKNKVAAIRGYDYNGYRAKLIAQGYELIDVPDGIDAIRLFMNKRTQHLLSYDGPFVDYVENNETNIGTFDLTKVKTQFITNIPTHYAISRASKHHDALVAIFNTIDSQNSNEYHLKSDK